MLLIKNTMSSKEKMYKHYATDSTLAKRKCHYDKQQVLFNNNNKYNNN